MKLEYIPAIDGLRAVSILCVVLSHAGNGMERLFPGTLGVIIFFAISGFVITRGLLQEYAQSGRISLGRFYQRRALRLLPALLLYLIVFVPLLWCLGADITGVHIASGLLYVANYYHIFIGYPDYNPLPILWSLAVEEHFYLLFPLLFLFLAKHPKMLALMLCAAIILILLWRLWLYSHCMESALWICGRAGQIRAHGTDAIADTICYGILAALLVHHWPEYARRLLGSKGALIAALAGLVIALIVRNPAFRETLRYSLEALCAALLIGHCLYVPASRITRILQHPWMVTIGKISYPLYLFHFGVLITIEALQGTHQLRGAGEILLYLGLSFAAALLCYYGVEQAVRRKRGQGE